MHDTKSYGFYLLGLYQAIFLDIASHEPRLRNDCRLDFRRLSTLVKTRGLPVLLVDLPSFGKAFDKALSEGHLPRTNLPCFGTSERGGSIPLLLKGMIRCVFDKSGALVSDPDKRCIKWIRQILYLSKSFKIQCPKLKEYESVQEFFETDGQIASPSLDWNDSDLGHVSARNLQFGDYLLHDQLSPSGNREEWSAPASTWKWRFCQLQRVSDIVSATIGRYDPADWRYQHGPGAVSEKTGSVWKYAFSGWSDHLEPVFPYADFAFANYAHWGERSLTESDGETHWASRLICVPKTYKGPRLIAAEPTGHQWCQQNIRDFLSSRVENTFLFNSIRFSDQTWNGRSALEGSRDGSLATIDLKSASDRVSLKLVERIFRSNPTLLQALMASRTRWMTQEIDLKLPRSILLKKFSTQGSAVTFPVQSIVFWCIAACGVLISEGLQATVPNLRSVSRKVRVYGDDIIVPNNSRPIVEELLHTLGLKVNTDKTYSRGLFRESCGVDAYAGHNVTPLHVNTVPCWSKPESIASSVDTANNFLEGGYQHAYDYIRATVNSGRKNSIPEKRFGSGSFGWLTFGEVDTRRYKYRYNSTLSRGEFEVTTLSSAGSRVPSNDNGMLLQYFTECHHRPIRNEERLGIASRKGSTRLRRSWVPATNVAG
jgi:hypothetical protein